MPSYDTNTLAAPNNIGSPAGTGHFTLFADDATFDISNQPLKVHYSVRNNREKEPVLLAPHQNFNGTFTFHCDTAVANYKNGAMKAVIKKALADWTCLTGIDWEMGTDTAFTGTVSAIDSICIIRFSNPTDSMATNVIASASFSYQNYSITGSSLLSLTKEVDIRLNNFVNFFCDTTGAQVPSGQRDLYSTILHELGHGHGLNHVIEPNAIMHHQYTGVKIDLANDLSAGQGGDYVMLRSTTYPSTLIMQNGSSKLNSVTCATNGIFEIENSHLDALVYPNPFNSEINIQLNIDEHTNATLNLYSINGQLIKNQTYSVTAGTNILTIATEELQSGIYILNLSIPTANIFSNQKIVK